MTPAKEPGTAVPNNPRSAAAVKPALHLAKCTLLATSLMVSNVYADPNDGNADVVFGSFIGVDELPPGTNGVADQINHDAITGQSQALVVDFGEEIASAILSVGRLRIESGCVETGVWTAFSSSGQKVGEDMFESTGNGGSSDPLDVEITTDDPFQYLVASAAPYPDGCERISGGKPDSSDYLIRSISYVTDGVEVEITGNSLSPLEESNFTAYDTFESFVAPNDQLLGPGGEPEGEFVVGDDICEGGSVDGETTDDALCEVEVETELFAGRIILPANGDIEGSFTFEGIFSEVDRRTICGYEGDDGISGNVPLELADFPIGDDGVLTIPAELCGIPDPDDGMPKIVVVDVESELVTENSVITTVVEDPTNPDYSCKEDPFDPDRRNLQPVLGWLPKAGEIPVTDAAGNRINVVEDLTQDDCGSYRKRAARFSYVVPNLVHRPDLITDDYVQIVLGELDQIDNTLLQTEACGISDKNLSAAQKTIDRIRQFVLDGEGDRYRRAREELSGFLTSIDEGEGIASEFGNCFYDLINEQVLGPIYGDPGDAIPRNFPGDVKTQGDHALYMVDDFLGAASSAYEGNTHRLSKIFTDSKGNQYRVTVALDQVSYNNDVTQSAFLKPEDYKAVVTPLEGAPPFKGGGKRVTCLKGPGVKGFGPNPMVMCTAKEGNGSKAPKQDFLMELEELPPEAVPAKARNRGLKINGKTLKGTIAGKPVFLTLDVMDYRNGNSHKAFIKAEAGGHKVDVSELDDGIELTSCTNGMLDPGTSVITGRGSPKVTCEFDNDNGGTTGTVILK